jgi:hypothetical protein
MNHFGCGRRSERASDREWLDLRDFDYLDPDQNNLKTYSFEGYRSRSVVNTSLIKSNHK